MVETSLHWRVALSLERSELVRRSTEVLGQVAQATILW